MRNSIKLLILTFAAALAAGCAKETEPASKPSGNYGAGLEAPAPAAPAPAEAQFTFPAERLSFLHAEMNAIASQYGAQVDMTDVQQAARSRLKDFLGGFSSSDASAMGLPAPERAQFTEEEKAARGPRAKWLDASGWKYGDSLPRDGASEGWARLIGSRDMSTGQTVFIVLDVPQDTWVRMKWQPARRRWAYFTEEEERAGIEKLLSSRYAYTGQEPHNSARFACERLKRAADKAVAAGRDASGFYANMRGSVIQAFDKDLEREALRYLAEEGPPQAPLR